MKTVFPQKTSNFIDWLFCVLNLKIGYDAEINDNYARFEFQQIDEIGRMNSKIIVDCNFYISEFVPQTYDSPSYGGDLEGLNGTVYLYNSNNILLQKEKLCNCDEIYDFIDAELCKKVLCCL